MLQDTIADLLTRIRNAQRAGHAECVASSSKLKVAILNVLLDEGYIQDFKIHGDVKRVLQIKLKYHDNKPVICKLIRISRPGLRMYVGWDEIKPVANGLGIAIISTSRGVMTDKHARKMRVGGELLCTVL
jgi:small subunit ribosomal protein S8